MDENQKYYYMVKFIPTKIMGGGEVHCIPASWIIEDKRDQTVMVAYPHEPWEVTRERAKNYENRGKNWTVCLAKILCSTDFYESVICRVNQREHDLEEFSDVKVITTEVRSPHLSYSAEFQKWLDRLSTAVDLGFSIENAMEKDPKVQFDSSGSAIVLDSDDDTPCDLSIRSSESRSTSESKIFPEGVCFPEVIIKEAGISDSPSSPNTWQFGRVNESNHLWSGFKSFFLNDAKLQHKASSININQAIEDGAHDKVYRDWCMNSSKVNEQWPGSSLFKGALIKPGGINTRWTLKHRNWLPGLVELWPNTDVYISYSELTCCLSHSNKCTQLTRLLTKHVFTEYALRKCQYVNNGRSCQSLRLDVGAITAIINFVLTYGFNNNWHPSSARSIKNAMRYELMLAKKKSRVQQYDVSIFGKWRCKY